MTLTRKQELPSRELQSKSWSKKSLSSFKDKVADITKKWSVFVYLLIAVILGTFVLEVNDEATLMWYGLVYLLVVSTGILEHSDAKTIDTGKPKKDEKISSKV